MRLRHMLPIQRVKNGYCNKLQANQRLLTAADWSAVCTSGTATSATGCYGNVSSAAFSKVSDRLGGFTTYANINPISASSSVFIKSFFGGTNVPVNANFLQVTLTNSAARCGVVSLRQVRDSAYLEFPPVLRLAVIRTVVSLTVLLLFLSTTQLAAVCIINNNTFGGTLTAVTGPWAE